VPLGVDVADTLVVLDGLGVFDGEEPSVEDAVGVPVKEMLALIVDVGDGDDVPVGELVTFEDGVPLVVGVAVILTEPELLPEFDGDVPFDIVPVGVTVGDDVSVFDVVGVTVDVCEPVPVDVFVSVFDGVDVAVTLAVGDSVGEFVLDFEIVPESDGDVPTVAVVDGDAVTEELPLTVVVAVNDAVGLAVPVAVCVGVAGGVCVDDTLVEPVTLAVFDGLAPRDSDGV